MNLFKDLMTRCSYMTCVQGHDKMWFNGFTLGVRETALNPRRFDQDKCFDLVWRSRQNRDEFVEHITSDTWAVRHQRGLKQIDRIDRTYPVDLSRMSMRTDGVYYHGLWSGRLATLRYLEYPEADDFPNFDT